MDKARQKELAEALEKLHRDVRDILNRHDPRGLISAGAPRSEYEPEIATILPRLREALAVEDVQRILYEEFSNWFGADDVPAEAWFEGPAREVWEVWRTSPIAAASGPVERSRKRPSSDWFQ